MDEFNVITLLTLIRDNMVNDEDKKILQNTIADLIEQNVNSFKIKFGLFIGS